MERKSTLQAYEVLPSQSFKKINTKGKKCENERQRGNSTFDHENVDTSDPRGPRGRKVTDPTSSAADVCRAGSRARLFLKDTIWCFPHFPLQPEAGFVFLAVLGLSYCTWDLVPRPGNRPRPRAWGPWGSQPPPGIPEWGPALWDGAGRGSPPPCHTSAPGRGS